MKIKNYSADALLTVCLMIRLKKKLRYKADNDGLKIRKRK